MPDEIQASEARAEIARLTAKQSAVEDEDIKLALQARIDALEAQLAGPKKEEPAAEDGGEESDEELVPATAAQIEQAENLIRQSKVEKMRGNSSRALTLMKEAAEVAPSAPAVLEALGDDLADRRQYKEAKQTYAKAMKLVQGNVGLEQKHARMALRSASLGSIEQQLRAGLSDSMLLTSADAVASLRSAKLLNMFFPGVGHLVLGRTAAGIGFLVAWIVCITLIVLWHGDFEKLVRFSVGKGAASPSLLVLLPIFLAFIVYVSSLATTGRGPEAASGRQRVDRPRPPVDLPFE